MKIVRGADDIAWSDEDHRPNGFWSLVGVTPSDLLRKQIFLTSGRGAAYFRLVRRALTGAAVERIGIHDGARIPHGLETGQQLDVTRRTAPETARRPGRRSRSSQLISLRM
jgi:hypothetical protein